MKLNNKNWNPLLLMGVAVMMAYSCSVQKDEITSVVPSPIIRIDQISDITYNGATCYSNLTSDEGQHITEIGVCWATSPNPDINGNHIANNLKETGQFSTSLTNLAVETTYYVRAYATTILGTTYGAELSFKTLGIPKIGLFYQGGIIAYIYKSTDPCYVSGEIHGIIASTTDIEKSIWGGSDSASANYADSYGFCGSDGGLSNQNSIINTFISGDRLNTAIVKCYNLRSNGYDDWFMPSIDELIFLYINRVAIGGFDLNEKYFSSTRKTMTNTYTGGVLGFQVILINFSNGASILTDNLIHKTRAIRYF